MSALLLVAALFAAEPPAAAPAPDLSPLARYNAALQALAQNRPGEASAILDQLIAEAPRVPEYFAARANAQLALQKPAFAAADAAWAVYNKPDLVSARYTLATAEERLGRAESAAHHYRLYAESKHRDVREEYRNEAWRRALKLAPPVKPPEPATATPTAATTPPTCMMGSNGLNACGYNCRLGSNGRAYCSTRPDATCAMNSDGSFTCP